MMKWYKFGFEDFYEKIKLLECGMVECEGKKLRNKGVAVFIDNWNSACPKLIRALP